MSTAPPLSGALIPLLLLIFLTIPVNCWPPWPNTSPNSTEVIYGGSKKYEGSSEFVKLKYHMGPVLTANITIYSIWYGNWKNSQKRIIREFISSISATDSKPPSVSGWWKTVQQYTDQTGANISGNVCIGEEKNDRFLSHGKSLTRLSVQSVIRSAVNATTRPLPINPKSGVYLLLTSDEVYVQDFCNNVCGFHYFTFPSIVGYTLPYAWVGNSANEYEYELIYGGSNEYEGSSVFVKLKHHIVKLKHHMGSVLTAKITVYTIWLGNWKKKRIIRKFISSISATYSKPPSVSGWWKTVQQYTDQAGANISRFFSHRKYHTRLSVKWLIISAFHVVVEFFLYKFYLFNL